jgi:hypothetical protein
LDEFVDHPFALLLTIIPGKALLPVVRAAQLGHVGIVRELLRASTQV